MLNLYLDFYLLYTYSYFDKGNILTDITYLYDFIPCDNIVLLNDAIFKILEKANLKNKVRYKTLFQKAYDLIYKYVKKDLNPVKVNYNNQQPSSLIPQSNIFLSDQLVEIIAFMTNKNGNLLRTFIKMISASLKDREYNSCGYLFSNCKYEMFTLYKTFFKQIGLENIIELESTHDLNDDKFISKIVNANITDTNLISVNKVSIMNKGTSKKIL